MDIKLSETDHMVWEFLTKDYAGGRILAADCSELLLSKLNELTPVPEVVRWTEQQQRSFCRNEWAEEMEGSFRYVLLGRLAERLEDVYALKDLREHLTYDGMVISLWGNVQHWSVIQNLFIGNWHFSGNAIFPSMPHRLYSQKEIMGLFQLMKYRDCRVNYLAIACKDRSWFERIREVSGTEPLSLDVLFWCVASRMYNEEITMLRGQMTPELRKELGRILRRIENDIEPEFNGVLAKELCDKQGLSGEYLKVFVKNNVVNPSMVWERLKEYIHE